MTDEVQVETETPPATPVLNGGIEPIVNAPETESDDDAQKAWYSDDWRAKIAGDDEKVMKQLERFSDPASAIKNGIAANQKIRSGEFKQPLSDEPSDEELAEYRADNGVPETAEAYAIEFPEDIPMTDSETKVFDDLKVMFHDKNVPQGTMDIVSNALVEFKRNEMAEMVETWNRGKEETEDHFRVELGAEYRGGMKNADVMAVKMFGDTAPDMMEALMPDGTKLGSNKVFIKALIDASYDKYGATGEHIPGDGGESLGARKDEIMKIMKTDIVKYRREGLASELKEILEREDAMKR